jgi:hypothetical protein
MKRRPQRESADMPSADFIRENVSVVGECWEWAHGGTSRRRYPALRIGDRTERLHRLSYLASFGNIPPGAHVRHKCDNAWCVRPDHLELGTHQDNMRDASERDRFARGERNGHAKLSAADVDAIRRFSGARLSKSEVWRRLAALYGVSPSTVRAVREGRNWRTQP